MFISVSFLVLDYDFDPPPTHPYSGLFPTKTVRNTHILDKQLKPYPINMTKCGATLIKNVSFDLHLIYAFNVSWHLWMFPVKKMGAHFKKRFKRL